MPGPGNLRVLAAEEHSEEEDECQQPTHRTRLGSAPQTTVADSPGVENRYPARVATDCSLPCGVPTDLVARAPFGSTMRLIHRRAGSSTR